MTDLRVFINGDVFVMKLYMNENNLGFSNKVITIPLLFVFVIWFIYWIEIKFGLNFNKLGVFPRTLKGIRGILTTHFIHGDAKHVFNNSVPLFVLLMSLLYFYREVSLKVIVYGGLITGFVTWCIGRPSYHIGASGIVYLLFSFIFFSGIIRKHYRLVAMSLVTIFLYGSMIWYIFPVEKGISWEGHLGGFLIGVIFAVKYRKKGMIKEKFVFSKNEFDDMFDEDGNYSPPQIEENSNLDEVINESKPSEGFTYKYIYIDSSSDSEE